MRLHVTMRHARRVHGIQGKTQLPKDPSEFVLTQVPCHTNPRLHDVP